MALTLGTNCGFVTTAPTADPSESAFSINGRAFGIAAVTPTGIAYVTEIGWWCDLASEQTNFEVGIYTQTAGNPGSVVGALSQVNTKAANFTGWAKVTGLAIPVSTEVTYWIGVQVDTSASGNNIDRNTSYSGGTVRYQLSQTALQDPWPAGSNTGGHMLAIYAVVSATAGGSSIVPILNSYRMRRS